MKPGFLIAWIIAAVGLLVCPFLVLSAPLEQSMGFVQKIFYYHVPSAFADFAAIYVCGVASVMYLFKRKPNVDAWAITAAELAVLFGAITLVTGSLWARKAWGVWWTWDARLTTFALCELIFVAYLLVRNYGGPGSESLCAGLAIFGCIDVPIIYKSVSLWRTLHPKAEVVRTLDPAMKPAFYASLVSIFALFIALFYLRLSVERRRVALDELYLAAEEADAKEQA